ncbi:EthD domain-containing protein [Novosphingobium sp. BL-8A]|uniref:EthD domain-containing protein n=1 Tax=Novosphingobium sp. BL-8A TaxID=3127639 RepID=UPI0037573B9D
MEKVVAALWAPEGETRADYAARLLESLPAALGAAGAQRIRLNLRDADVAPADMMVQRWQAPQQDAVVQFWVDSANGRFRGAVDAVLAAHSARFAAWLVCESTIIANADHPPQPEARTWGFSQSTFLAFRTDLPREAALAHWVGEHTRVAIETQSNFEYVQNIVVRPLTEDAPAYDAFVEECFPPEAMTAPEVFFDALGDPVKFEANARTMMDSCTRFIDFSRIDVIPTSQYRFAD